MGEVSLHHRLIGIRQGRCRRRLKREQLKKVVRLKEWLQSRPDFGLDCLNCAESAQQRTCRRGFRGRSGRLDVEVISHVECWLLAVAFASCRERKFFFVNILVGIHFIIMMIWWTGLALWAFEFFFSGSLISTFLVAKWIVRCRHTRWPRWGTLARTSKLRRAS